MPRVIRALAILMMCSPLAALLWPRGAGTVPLYAARTGLACGSCHFDPNGGGPRNEFGFGFAKNRHSVEGEPEGSPWKDLTLTNRVGENMPVYFGVNQRFMVLANTTVVNDSLDRFGFFNMESAIHIAFQPHPRLTLVYSNDAFSTAPGGAGVRFNQREAYGRISGFPWDGYVRAGRFRVPFGLRMDDHTVATRVGFLDFVTGQQFLPYDPRLPDMGVEIGAERSGVFGRLSYTDGRANLLVRQYAETKTVKLGYRHTMFEGAVSLYDDYTKTNISNIQRQTRWGLYGLTHWRQLALLGEVALGTDEAEPPAGRVTGDKTNRLAGWAELDYALSRSINLRTRFDYLVTDRGNDPAGAAPRPTVREASTFSRWALEGEWVPVPFAELRGTLRHIDYKENQGLLSVDNENQAYIQFHFSY